MIDAVLNNTIDENDPGRHHFLGCSIRGFDLNIGWGGESSTLTVGLVEDDMLFERFDGSIGELVRFQFKEFFFDGILLEANEIKGESGNRVWEVTISDPRELLDGVNLILDQYSGFTYGISNLYNIFGYLESTGFGNSGVNSSGMLLSKIKQTFTTLNRTTPVYLGGTPIFIDISSLPNISPDFRISDNNVSLLRLITDVCEIANCDYSFIMVGNFLQLKTVSRNIPQLNGSIYRFIQKFQEVTSSESGFKLQYNPCSKFLVGAPVENVYFQYHEEFNNNLIADDTIAKYFGLNAVGNVIVPVKDEKLPGNEIMLLPAKQIGYIFYPTDLQELRAVANGMSEWEEFLKLNEHKPQHKDKLPKLSFGDYKSAKELKAEYDKMIKGDDPDLGFLPRIAAKTKDFDVDEQKAAYTERVYQFLNIVSREYLDVQFMVRIPNIQAKYDEELKKIITSVEPSESGYVDESLHPQMIQNGLLPEYTNFVLDENNKIQAYARFGPFAQRDELGFYSASKLDISSLNEDQYYIQDIPHRQYGFVSFLFVKCTIEPDLVFINRYQALSPRAVVKLPGPVYYDADTEIVSILEDYFVDQKLIEEYSSSYIRYYGIKLSLKNPADPGHRAAVNIVNKIREKFKGMANKIGYDFINNEFQKTGLMPTMIALPLKSNVETYGPWYFKRNNGRTIYENNNDMAPWNYGGFQNLNAVGASLVSEVAVETMIEENGSIEVPGTPIFRLVDEIVPSGPVITRISTSIGENGVRTTYGMDRWKANYGKLNEIRIQQQRKLLQEQRDNNRRFRELFKKPEPLVKSNALFRKAPPPKPRHKLNKSAHTTIFSEIIKTNDSGYQINSGLAPSYYLQNILNRSNLSGIKGIDSVASIGLESLFMPYDIKENEWMPYVEEIEEDEGDDEINFNKLNPLKSGSTIQTIEKGVAFRGPIMIAGWGYDTNGDPVPSSGNDFPKDYLKNPASWKVGPLDTRWDDERKVWAASGGGGTKFFKLAEDIIGTEAYARECDHNGSGIDENKPPVKVVNWQGIINGAKAGYVAKYELHKGKWKFGQGVCPDNRCAPVSGYLSVPNFPNGTISGFYDAQITYGNILGNVSNTTLPPGLVRNGPRISGYPAEAGDFYVTFTAAAETVINDQPATCIITRMGKFTIKASGVN